MKGPIFLVSLIICCSYQPCVFGQAKSEVLTPDMMIALVPQRLKDFYLETESVGKTVTLGTIKYSLCEKRFVLKEQRIKILLFDFVQAEIMYAQAAKRWDNQPQILTDSLIRRPLIIDNCSGWESYSKSSNTSQVFLGICDRFFLTITGENTGLETLKLTLDQFDFGAFPKK